MFSYFKKDNKIKRAFEKNSNLINQLNDELNNNVLDKSIKNIILDKINQLCLIQELLIDSLDSKEADKWKLFVPFTMKGNIFWIENLDKVFENIYSANNKSILETRINSSYLKSDAPETFVYPYRFKSLNRTIDSKLNIIANSSASDILKKQLVKKQLNKRKKILNAFNKVLKNDALYNWSEYNLFCDLSKDAKKFDIIFITKIEFNSFKYFQKMLYYITKKYKVNIVVLKEDYFN